MLAVRNTSLLFAFSTLVIVLGTPVQLDGQDSATGSIRGTVVDPAGARVMQASIVVVNAGTGTQYTATSDSEGHFALELLLPGDYSARVEAQSMSPQVSPPLHVVVGGVTELVFRLKIAGAQESLTVSSAPAMVETKPSAVSTLLDERSMNDFPLNGRRFSDLALFSPGVTQDPRGLTSATSGDLSFGGIRGVHNTFLVDGSDYNKAFFAQARGRYRAPYQFSTEVVQEFRVSSNAYGAEQGRSGGAVVNVVTKSGSNHLHGTVFYHLRDSSFGASVPFLAFKPHNRQQQVGGTIGGPLKRNKIFFFTGFDQHIFHVPNVVEFLNGSSRVLPLPSTGPYSAGDYEATDQDLVRAAAAQLTSLAGEYPAAQIGNSSYAKLDINLNPRNQLAFGVNTTRYWGSNNVFLDPASPITYDSISNNGKEHVSTETANLSLTSSITPRLISNFRAQFSRDQQQSYSNSSDVLVKIPTIPPAGEFVDIIQHRPDQNQTGTLCSSIDPWHSESDIDTHGDQTGLDLFFTSGITNNLPAMIPISLLYGTPHDAAAQMEYLKKRGYPISYIEMGEEPDGQYMLPEDYAELYLQFATAMHKVDPNLKLGGPVFEGVNEDIKVWPDVQGRTSWLGRFLDYLKARNRISDLAFMSFEHYPFPPCEIVWADLFREPHLISHILDVWRQDGLPANVPMMNTESNVTYSNAQQMADIFAALWLADSVGAFLTASGAVYYHSPIQPEPLPGCHGFGTYGNYVADEKLNVKTFTSQYTPAA